MPEVLGHQDHRDRRNQHHRLTVKGWGGKVRQPEPRRLGEGGEVQRFAKAQAVSQQGVQRAGDDQADQDQQSLQHPAGKYRHYADAEHS